MKKIVNKINQYCTNFKKPYGRVENLIFILVEKIKIALISLNEFMFYICAV